MNPIDWLDFISRGGVVAVLGYFLFKLFKGDIRLNREVTEKEAQLTKATTEREKWERIAFEALQLGDRVTRVAENGK